MEGNKLKITRYSDYDMMTTSELLEIARIKKAALHELLMEIFPEVKTSQLPGSSQASPHRKYYALRIKTPLERLSSGDTIISIGTKFEANSLTTKILHELVELDSTSLDSMHLVDIEKVECGIS